MVKGFYRDFGFRSRREDADGSTEWDLSIDEYKPATIHMDVEVVEPSPQSKPNKGV